MVFRHHLVILRTHNRIIVVQFCGGAKVLSHFNFMQKFCFQYQLGGKGLENNFGPSVKLSGTKIQNGR